MFENILLALWFISFVSNLYLLLTRTDLTHMSEEKKKKEERLITFFRGLLLFTFGLSVVFQLTQ